MVYSENLERIFIWFSLVQLLLLLNNHDNQGGGGASSARVLPHEPALCLHIQKGNWYDNLLSG